MELTGQINPESLFKLFGELAESGKKMLVNFTSIDGESVQVLYQEGVFSYIPSEGHKGLDIYLVGMGHLTIEQVEELLKYKEESGISLEEIIIQAEVLTSESLSEIKNQIAEDFIIDLFTWEEGKFEVKETSSDVLEIMGEFPMESLGQCEVALQKRFEILEKIGGYQAVHHLNQEKVQSWLKSNQNVANQQVVTSVDGKNSVRNIFQWSFVTKGMTLEILAKFADAGLWANGEENKKTVENATPSEEEVTEEAPVNEGPIEVNTDTPLPNSGNFVGSLSVLSLIEVMQTLNTARRTGILMLDIDKGPAEIKIQKGEVVSVSYNELKNRDAFYAIVKIHKGDFYFETMNQTFEREMEIPTMSLLMEAMRLSDEGSAGVQSEEANLSDFEGVEEAPRSARSLKKKSSTLSLVIKGTVVFALLAICAYGYFIYKPSIEKNKQFSEVRDTISPFIRTKEYQRAVEQWKEFLGKARVDRPDWVDEINLEIANLKSEQKKEATKVLKEVDSYIMAKNFKGGLQYLESKKILTIGDQTLVRKFEDKKGNVIASQKKEDYLAWKLGAEQKIKDGEKLKNSFENEKALQILQPLVAFVDKEKDAELFQRLNALLLELEDREKKVKDAYLVIDDRMSKINDKVKAYQIILENVGENTARGKLVKEALANVDKKIKAFEDKVSQVLDKPEFDTISKIMVKIKALETEATSLEEIQYLQRLHENKDTYQKNSEKLFQDLQKDLNGKNSLAAFLKAQELIRSYPLNDHYQELTLPYLLVGDDNIEITIDGAKEKLPYSGFIKWGQKVSVKAIQPGCDAIELVLDQKSVEKYENALVFSKKLLWEKELKGDLKTIPKVVLNGQAIALANGIDLEVLFLKNGSTIWRRQVNFPNQPYIKINGSKMVMGDDAFWLLQSQITTFENFIAIGSKNGYVFVFNAQDGNQVLKHQLPFELLSPPMIEKLSLLGNKPFLFTGTMEGTFVNIGLSDAKVRFESKIGKVGNGVMDVVQNSDYTYAVVLEDEVICYGLSAIKEKWRKPLNTTVKKCIRLFDKNYVMTSDGLMEIGQEADDWALITFPERNLKSFHDSQSGMFLSFTSGNQYYFSDKDKKFIAIDKGKIQLESALQHQNYILGFNENKLVCFQIDKNRVVWEYQLPQKANYIATSGAYFLVKSGEKLYVFTIP